MPADPSLQKAYANLGNGIFVEQDVLSIARRVNEYDPNLKVQFLNDATRDVTEPPYRIVELCKDGVERPLFSVWMLDETVLQRIYAADNEKWNVLSVLDKQNARAKAQEKRRYKEALGEAHEITRTVLASPKSTFTVPQSVLDGGKGSSKELVKFRDTPGG